MIRIPFWIYMEWLFHLIFFIIVVFIWYSLYYRFSAIGLLFSILLLVIDVGILFSCIYMWSVFSIGCLNIISFLGQVTTEFWNSEVGYIIRKSYGCKLFHHHMPFQIPQEDITSIGGISYQSSPLQSYWRRLAKDITMGGATVKSWDISKILRNYIQERTLSVDLLFGILI